jgi:uncharacterized membrane protein
MRFHRLIPALVVCALVIFVASSLNAANAQEFVQYKVQVNVDGSASWTITQASGLNGTIDTWKGFQERVSYLVSSVANQFQRTMAVDPNSLQLNTIWENQSQTTEYQFTWLNFSILQGNHIVFGDVFRLNGFFSKLYGDGELKVVFPLNYTFSSVSPQPNGGNSSPDTLDWLGTDFFVNGNPLIVLIPSAPSPSPTQTANAAGLSLYAFVGSGIAVAAVAFSVVFYLLRRGRDPKAAISPTGLPPTMPIVESEEGKILKTLQASGGSAYQSAITEQCRFSKSKTSQLLTALEKRGVVRRYKKGRDKIVTLTEQSKLKGDLS